MSGKTIAEMDGYWNFKNDPTRESDRLMNEAPISASLSRQGSIYSWTVNQFQNSLGRDCGGSMNMDELIKTINSAEKTQGEGLHRQGSIILPRILSQKTIDEVWKYITEEEEEHTGTNIPHIQRQQTLGETTLEEFLIRAGMKGDNNNGGYFRDPSSSISANPNACLGVGFQQKPMQQLQGCNLHRNVNGFTSTYQPQQPIMSSYGYGPQIGLVSGQANTHGIRGGFMGIGDQSLQENNISLVPTVAAFPLLDGIRKNNGDSSLISPSQYIFSGSNIVRGRKRNNVIAMEKRVVDKTQRRKIKNRESAARSRARKEVKYLISSYLHFLID